MHRIRSQWSQFLFLPGLFLLLPFGSRASIFAAGTLQVANSPDNNLALARQAIQSARQSLLINLYEFTEPTLADAIEERIRAGVRVEILQEGHPVAGLTEPAKKIQARLIQAIQAEEGSRFSPSGQGAHYYLMGPSAQGKRRFRFDHAKYMVIDSGALWIASENFSPSGMPAPGTRGNRGWGALIQNSTLSAEFSALFRSDTSLEFGDVAVLAGHAIQKGIDAVFFDFQVPGVFNPALGTWPDSEKTGVPPVSAFPVFQTSSLNGIHSPDTSQAGVLALIRSATRSLDIQQMSFYFDWKNAEGTYASPLVEALIAAAKRGVHVRVLLNDEKAFLDQYNTEEYDTASGSAFRQRNRETVDALNQIGDSQSLPIRAQIADLNAMGTVIIHNKGMIVDGRITLVSSINWNENSITRNRESGVVIDSVETANYFGSLFDRDWRLSNQLSAD